VNDQAAEQATDRVGICHSGESEPFWALGSLFERLVAAEHTGGSLGAMIVTQPPGTATPTHLHTREAEAWFVLDGTVTYRAGGELTRLGSGDFIYLPKDVPHAFRVDGSRPVRYLALSFPGALLDLYTEIGVPAGQRRLPDGGLAPGDVEAWNRLAPSYGLRIVGPPIPDPAERDDPIGGPLN
jgi:quercetin dioxygenase-like cupin family protein